MIRRVGPLPARRWDSWAVAVVVAFAVIGVGLFVIGLIAAIRGVPLPRVQFGAGRAASTTLTPDRSWAIWADTYSGGHAVARSRCAVTPLAAGSARLTSPGVSFQRGRWKQIGEVRVSRAGPYRVTCGRADGWPARYGLGEAPQVGRFVGQLLGAIAALLVLPLLGVLLGLRLARRHAAADHPADLPR